MRDNWLSNRILRSYEHILDHVRAWSAWVGDRYAVLIPGTIDGADLRGARNSSHYGRVVNGLLLTRIGGQPRPPGVGNDKRLQLGGPPD